MKHEDGKESGTGGRPPGVEAVPDIAITRYDTPERDGDGGDDTKMSST